MVQFAGLPTAAATDKEHKTLLLPLVHLCYSSSSTCCWWCDVIMKRRYCPLQSRFFFLRVNFILHRLGMNEWLLITMLSRYCTTVIRFVFQSSRVKGSAKEIFSLVMVFANYSHTYRFTLISASCSCSSALRVEERRILTPPTEVDKLIRNTSATLHCYLLCAKLSPRISSTD